MRAPSRERHVRVLAMWLGKLAWPLTPTPGRSSFARPETVAMKTESELTEYEATFTSLAGLTRAQIAGLVTEGVSREEAESFTVLVANLSDEALRFLSARALVRRRQGRRGHEGGRTVEDGS
jgi:hypothetical protein